MSFDTPIDRTGTHCAKWDMMPSLYGLPPGEGRRRRAFDLFH